MCARANWVKGIANPLFCLVRDCKSGLMKIMILRTWVAPMGQYISVFIFLQSGSLYEACSGEIIFDNRCDHTK